MKKITVLLLCIVTLGMASCKKETLVGPQNILIVRDISPNQWSLINNGETFTTSLSIGEIDQYHVDNEGTLVYISYNNGASYTQMPFVYNVDAYSYEVYNGGISIDIESSDFQDRTPVRPTSNVKVKIVLVSTD